MRLRRSSGTPMADSFILAVDQGTGSTKCLLVASDGTVVSQAAVPIDSRFPEPTWVEQSPSQIWASVTEAVGRCLDNVGSRGPRDPSDVVALGLSTQRESLVLWETASGNAVGPMLGWQDQRTVLACERLRATGAAATIRQLSGLPLDPMFSASKAGWLLDRYDPDRRRSSRGELRLGTVDSWLMQQLVGTHTIELGNAARTQLLDVRTCKWSDELLTIFGIPREVLPEVTSSAHHHGATRDLPGLPDGVPLTAVLADSHAALFAHGVFEPGLVKATIGTGSSVMGLVETDREVGSGLCLTIAWDAGQPVYAAEGNIRSSGATLTWLAGLFSTTPERILEMAETTVGHGVHLVPAFGGLAAPWWDDRASGTLTGLTLGTGPGEVARAAAESIVLQINDVLSAVAESVGHVDGLLVDGGGSANDGLMQMQADVSQLPAYRATATELSALGAAHLAGLSAGVWDLDDLRALPRERACFRPRDTVETAHARIAAWHTALARARYRPDGELAPGGAHT